MMAETGVVLLDSNIGRKILREACNKEKIQITTIEELVIAEMEQIGKLRKRGLYDRFDEIIDAEICNEGE
jgi:glyceraldehyde-3-phosphate dehydrogenase/erythrose-4-phosphate dehydrogenase